MVRVPYEDNKFVGTSVIFLVFMGFILPISVATIFGFGFQVVQSPPPFNPSPQDEHVEITVLPPPQYMTVGNGTAFDSLVNETTDQVVFASEDPVFEVVGDSITITGMYPTGNISINETEALDIAETFISSFDYLQGFTLDLSASLSDRQPVWIVNSQVEGGSVVVSINAVSGIVCFYAVNVDLQETSDLRLYFSGSGNKTLVEAETTAYEFLQQNNYTLANGSRYNNPYYRPLPPGVINEGFENGEYIFQITGMEDGIVERSNKVIVKIEGSTGAVVYFSYLWTEHPDFPEADIIDVDNVEDTAIDCLINYGIKVDTTIEYPYLVLDADWFPDIGYSGSIYWRTEVEGGYIGELHISPISGEVIGGVTTSVTTTGVTATGTMPAPAIDFMLPMGIVFILPLSSFSLGLAGYIIVKNRQSRRIIGRNET
ncbi:hypothetical protein EU528_08865 [Candidatus Thorarchaeota archaeon]|nr:MAG: hypothetical protein EU528_08865 [Candidatus Thorarchaeota archaeon]